MSVLGKKFTGGEIMGENTKRFISIVLSLLMISSSIIVYPAYADLAP
jgi:hypothetical protein